MGKLGRSRAEGRWRLWLLVCGCLAWHTAGAQHDSVDSSRIRLLPVFTAGVHPSYVPPTNEFLAGENEEHHQIDRAVSYHLKVGWKFHPQSYMGRLYPDTYQGIGISRFNFFEKEHLGSPVAVYAFQSAPIYRWSPRLSVHYEWNFGISFGWVPYSEENRSNHVIGTRSNFYLHTAAFLDYRLDNHLHLQIGPVASHFSNGNTGFPNTGVNEIGLRMGVTYDTSPLSPPSVGSKVVDDFQPHVNYDVLLFGAMRRKGVYAEDGVGIPLPHHFGVGGMNVGVYANLSRRWRLGGSLDYVYDESLGVNPSTPLMTYAPPSTLTYTSPPAVERMALGVSARAEFVMPVFAINMGVGYNVYHKSEDARGFYQLLGLKTSLSRNLYLLVGYSLHNMSTPNHLMFGVGYRFHNRRKW